MSHANAALTPRARLRLARLIVDHGWPIARAAERYDVSWPTAKRWAIRYLQVRTELAPDAAPAAVLAGMGDRSSRPHHSPNKTPAPVVRKIVHLRWKQRLGPVAIADQVGVASSTVHKSWSGAGSTGSPTWTGPPGSRSAATSTNTTVTCCMWM